MRGHHAADQAHQAHQARGSHADHADHGDHTDHTDHGGHEVHVVRVRFAKRGRVRFISHRDVARAFERGLRVAGVPVAVTRGFTPHPRIGFGLALAVGHESDAEYLDVGLERAVEPVGVVDGLAAVLPEGLTPGAAADLAPGAPALQEAVTSVEYLVRTGVGPEDCARRSCWRSSEGSSARRPGSGSPNGGCAAPANGWNAEARGGSRSKPIRARVHRRCARRERRNRCPTRP